MTMNKSKSVEYSKWVRENYPVTEISYLRRKPLFGIGINDSDYLTQSRSGGEKIQCPVYSAWYSMLSRAYSSNYHERQPTYKGVTVCEEWLLFSNFRVWWLENYVDGWQLDKDLLVIGNRVYSPDTCIYIPRWLNSFLLDCGASRGKYKIGVIWNKQANKFQVRCRNSLSNNKEHLGYFDNEDTAHAAWLARKLEIAFELKPKIDKIDLRIYPNVVDTLIIKNK